MCECGTAVSKNIVTSKDHTAAADIPYYQVYYSLMYPSGLWVFYVALFSYSEVCWLILNEMCILLVYVYVFGSCSILLMLSVFFCNKNDILHQTLLFIYCVLQSIFKGAKSCIGEQG